MSALLPPPPPRHPSSSRTPQVRSSETSTSNRSSPPASRIVPTSASVPLRSNHSTGKLPLATEAPRSETRSSESTAPVSTPPLDSDVESTGLSPPPRHPDAKKIDDASRKLAEIEDLEVAEMLDRVGGRLQEIRVRADDEIRLAIEYPNRQDFTDPEGRVDWTSFATAYVSTLIVNWTPPELVGHPPRDEFSVRFFRDDLSRFYVLCPPAIWQGYLLKDLARLYRWHDPVRTGKLAAIYAFLWIFDLVPLFPIGLLIYHMLLPRLSPPTPEAILAASNERRSRTAEAAELSKQLKNSSAGRGLGFAAEGIRGVFGDIKDKLPVGRSSTEEKNLASALGSTALLGGMAGANSEFNDTLRKRFGKNLSESLLPASASSTSLHENSFPAEIDDDDSFDPSPATDKTGEVSLYRLVRNLAHSFGPPVQTILNEAIDLSEMVRNVIQHPDHPASLPVLLRLVAVFVIILVTPTWLRLKSAFGYVGIEFFLLWKLREMFPQYRRATMIQWWILAGAPTDAEYALYVLRKRGMEGRAVRGSKTIRRMARRSRASSNADIMLDKPKGVHRLAKSVTDTASIRSFDSFSSGTRSDANTNTYFAFHRSVPGQLVLTSTAIRFVPAKRLRKLGFQKLVARAAKKWDPSIELDESYYHDGDQDSLRDSDASDDRENEVEMLLRMGEIEKVKKEKHYRLPALTISNNRGEIWKFTNVSRRDDVFNKLLSFSAAPGATS